MASLGRQKSHLKSKYAWTAQWLNGNIEMHFTRFTLVRNLSSSENARSAAGLSDDGFSDGWILFLLDEFDLLPYFADGSDSGLSGVCGSVSKETLDEPSGIFMPLIRLFLDFLKKCPTIYIFAQIPN